MNLELILSDALKRMALPGNFQIKIGTGKSRYDDRQTYGPQFVQISMGTKIILLFMLSPLWFVM